MDYLSPKMFTPTISILLFSFHSKKYLDCESLSKHSLKQSLAATKKTVVDAFGVYSKWAGGAMHLTLRDISPHTSFCFLFHEYDFYQNLHVCVVQVRINCGDCVLTKDGEIGYVTGFNVKNSNTIILLNNGISVPFEKFRVKQFFFAYFY